MRAAIFTIKTQHLGSKFAKPGDAKGRAPPCTPLQDVCVADLRLLICSSCITRTREVCFVCADAVSLINSLFQGFFPSSMRSIIWLTIQDKWYIFLSFPSPPHSKSSSIIHSFHLWETERDVCHKCTLSPLIEAAIKYFRQKPNMQMCQQQFNETYFNTADLTREGVTLNEYLPIVLAESPPFSEDRRRK